MTDAAEATLLRPDSVEAVQSAVQAALEAETPLALRGAGTKRRYGRPVELPRTLALDALRGVLEHQPEELICVVRPGTPLLELEAELAAKGQELAFEPPHWNAQATIGGVVASDLAGPRRFRSGAARDHLLGFQAVTGRGELIRGGGRVVKNVTGYDVSKLMCGSFGTLAVLTELCVKVLPKAEFQRTVLAAGLQDGAALEVLRACGATPHDPSGLAHLPPSAVLPLAVRELAGAVPSITAVRVEGPQSSVRYRSERLAGLFPTQTVFLEQEESAAMWRALRELEPLPLEDGQQLWRFSLPGTAAVALVERLQGLNLVRHGYDWGGALLWAVLPTLEDAAPLHRAAAEAGGHARLVDYRGDFPPGLQVQTPLSAAVLQLHLNLKQAFDPKGILNPGRIASEF